MEPSNPFQFSQGFYLGGPGPDSIPHLTDWAIAETLLYPASATYVSSNDTYYYKRQIQLRDKSTGKVVAVKYVNVIVARATQNIITAYPSSS